MSYIDSTNAMESGVVADYFEACINLLLELRTCAGKAVGQTGED